jgi:sirohydrochlorin cobaltochelatase
MTPSDTSRSAPTLLILFAHGARDPQWRTPFEQLRTIVAAQRPDLTVELAYLELMSPSLADCVAAAVANGHRQISLVPAFMARGAHLRRDLPALIEALMDKHIGITIDVLPALGEVESILAAMADWIATAVPHAQR